MSSKQYTPSQEITDHALNNDQRLIDTFKALLTKYPYIYVRYMLDKTVSELGEAAADNTEQLAHYDAMIKHQTWAKKD